MNPSIRITIARAFVTLGMALSALALSWGSALAQAYPERPIKVVVPWPAGGAADIAARIITAHLARKFPQPVMVENRPGANGIIAAEVVAKSAPDGYTLLLVTGEPMAFNPAVYSKLPYDPLRDFVAITPIAKVLYVFAGRSELPATSAKEAISLVQSMPDKLTYGSWGIGSLGHIGMELIVGQAGLKIRHVPFNGGPPAYLGLAAGQTDVMIMPISNATSFVTGGKIKIFGITAPDRFSLMKDIPTMKEQGYDVDIRNHVGIVAPSKTPPAVVQKLHVAINEVLALPDVQSALRMQGMEPFTLSQQEYSNYLRTELTRWGQIIRGANINIQ